MSKSVLITGTSQGIGHALTKLLLINSYRVIGTNTTGIDNINEHNYKSFTLDLSNLDSIAAFEKNFQLDNIKIDILINNAGIGPDLDFELPEAISFKKTFDVNVTGTTLFTENEMVDMIEKIIKENTKYEKGKVSTSNVLKSSLNRSGKEENDYIKSVTKKMKEYLKDASKGDNTSSTEITKEDK